MMDKSCKWMSVDDLVEKLKNDNTFNDTFKQTRRAKARAKQNVDKKVEAEMEQKFDEGFFYHLDDFLKISSHGNMFDTTP